VNDQSGLDELIHDIRNRLTVARANVEAFIDGKLEPTGERLASVLRSLEQAGVMLERIRSAPAVPETTMQPAEIDICGLLDAEYPAIDALAREKGVRFSVCRCPVKSPDCERFIADPVRIGQIVNNVLMNAVRYTPTGGIVSVDCSRKAGHLELSVSDSGPGVSEDERVKVFDRGFRGAASAGTSGHGYGLAISRAFVEAHGGTIAVSSSAENGARFTIRLPGTVVR